MSADSDDELGAHLDAYLTSLEKGESPSSRPHSSANVRGLEGIVTELHGLARFVTDPARSAADAAEIPARIGKYEVRQWLGRGGQSTTFLAHDPDLERTVVIKRYHNAGTAEQRDRLLNEARSLARVHSPHIAHCFDADKDGSVPFLVLEHVAGRSLSQLRTLDWTIRSIVALAMDVAAGLRDVHKFGLIHRDVKPANIIVADDGDARIVDFGMAHIMSTHASSASGTPAYMAPEQARGETDRIDARTDVFGLGAVLYELLTGEAPFARNDRTESLLAAQRGLIETPAARRRFVPRGLMRICRRCLAPEKLDRYESIDQFIAAIEKWKWNRRLMWAAPALAALLLMAWSIMGSRDSRRPASPRSAATTNWVARQTPLQAEELPEDVFKVFAIDGQLRQDFLIEVEILGASKTAHGTLRLNAGDRLGFRIRSERDCYITIVSCGPEPPIQLFPCHPFDRPQDAFVQADRPTTIPNSNSEHFASIRAVPSKGKEAICVMASSVPISLGNSSGEHFLVFQSTKKIDALETRMRALVRHSESSEQTISQLVIPYWVDKVNKSADSQER